MSGRERNFMVFSYVCVCVCADSKDEDFWLTRFVVVKWIGTFGHEIKHGGAFITDVQTMARPVIILVIFPP